MECFAIVSHHARMRCFLNKWLEGPANENNVLKMKFNNASVLEIYFGGYEDIHVNVVWGGGDVKPVNTVSLQSQFGPNYVGGAPFASVHLAPEKYKFQGSMAEFEQLQGKTFYTIRHGEGIHNTASKWDKYTTPSNFEDAKLTPNGKVQAFNAGKALKQWLYEKAKSIDMFFVSDLQRTHETCREIITALHGNDPNKPIMYVLPCLHELSTGCDSDWFNMYTAYENRAVINKTVKDVEWYYYPETDARSKSVCERYNVFVEAVKAFQHLRNYQGRVQKHKNLKRVVKASGNTLLNEDPVCERANSAWTRSMNQSLGEEEQAAHRKTYKAEISAHPQCDQDRLPRLSCLTDEQYQLYNEKYKHDFEFQNPDNTCHDLRDQYLSKLFPFETTKKEKFNKIVRGLTRKQQFDPQHQLDLYGSETAPVYEGPRKGGRKSRRSKRKRTRRK